MSFHLSLAAAFLVGGAASALADGHQPRLYPYNASANYCPAGTQPIVVNGVICCGTPNQHISYSAMMQHLTTRQQYVSPSYFDTESIKGTGD
jgi:hypothetical protein